MAPAALPVSRHNSKYRDDVGTSDRDDKWTGVTALLTVLTVLAVMALSGVICAHKKRQNRGRKKRDKKSSKETNEKSSDSDQPSGPSDNGSSLIGKSHINSPSMSYNSWMNRSNASSIVSQRDKSLPSMLNELQFYDAPDIPTRCAFHFALDFYRVACKSHSENKDGVEQWFHNKAVSPLAVQSALYSAYLGANGACKEQIRKAIFPRLPAEEEAGYVEQCVRTVACYLDGPSDLLAEVGRFRGFSMALRVYAPSNRFQYSPKFYDVLSSNAGRCCDFVEYRFDPVDNDHQLPLSTLANAINHYVTGASGRQIMSVTSEDELRRALASGTKYAGSKKQTASPKGSSKSSSDQGASAAGLVVVAQVRVKCHWMVNFPSKTSYECSFTMLNGSQSLIRMMSVKSDLFGFHQDQHCLMARLHLVDVQSKADMYVILPKKRGALLELESYLTGDRLLQMMQHCQLNTDVVIHLPKMFVDSVQSPSRTINALKQLGMTAAFDPSEADFSSMLTKKQPLYIATVLHNASLEAYEDKLSKPSKEDNRATSGKAPKELKANHPFIFIVASGAHRQLPILIGRFAGRMSNEDDRKSQLIKSASSKRKNSKPGSV